MRTERTFTGAALLAALLLSAAGASAQAGAKTPKGGYAPKPAPLGYPLKAAPLKEVKLADGFWSQRMKTHMDVTIPHVLKTLDIDYADPKPGRSALALVRTLEGAAYCLMIRKDPKLQSMMDKICANIGDQCSKGNRWFGGCPEAAVFHYFATGKASSWLKEADKEYRRRAAEYFDKEGKPLKEPEPHAYYGMAVVSLYMATGSEFYRDLGRSSWISGACPPPARGLGRNSQPSISWSPR